ncbi:hypothetical protein [Halorientalis halophila]|uniref:hypothetical protein n=1 Tax=Halorientalis halophila TaxID=3108499 RepID=UPI00300AFB01
MSTRDVGTKWDRWLDVALVGWPVGFSLMALAGIVYGVAIAGDGNSVLGGMAGIMGVLLVGLPVLGVALGVVLAVSLYMDASSLGETGIEWVPSPVLYAIGGLLIPLVGYNYLWRRYKYLPRKTHESVWWYATVILGGISAVLSLVGLVDGVGIGMAVGFPAAIVLSGPVAATIYMDARFLHEKAAREQSGKLNPANYLLGMWFATLIGTALLPIQVLVLGYYAYKRQQIAGLR